MELEAIWTAAFVRALSPTATPTRLSLSAGVHTECSRLVQLVSTWTHAPEAAVRVLARAGCWTQSLLLHALVNVQTPVTILLVARGTHADIAALCVDTVMLADVLASGALINVPTCSAISVQLVARWTATFVGTKGVEALMFTRARLLCTFVDIQATCP